MLNISYKHPRRLSGEIIALQPGAGPHSFNDQLNSARSPNQDRPKLLISDVTQLANLNKARPDF